MTMMMMMMIKVLKEDRFLRIRLQSHHVYPTVFTLYNNYAV